jgi:hypothetical protein
MEIGEAMHREMQKLIEQYSHDLALEMYTNRDQIPFKELKGRTYVENGFVFAPYVPVLKPVNLDYVQDGKTTGVMTRYATKRINPGFFGTITFPALKNVTPGTIRELFQNPCGEQLLENPLGVEEDYYIPKRAPAVIADPAVYPHKCTRCGAPAYVGFTTVDCSRKSCC